MRRALRRRLAQAHAFINVKIPSWMPRASVMTEIACVYMSVRCAARWVQLHGTRGTSARALGVNFVLSCTACLTATLSSYTRNDTHSTNLECYAHG